MRSPTCGAAATRIRERKKRLTEGKIGFGIPYLDDVKVSWVFN
jgi:hypothetical protein